jgi:hypothetical protein
MHAWFARFHHCCYYSQGADLRELLGGISLLLHAQSLLGKLPSFPIVFWLLHLLFIYYQSERKNNL